MSKHTQGEWRAVGEGRIEVRLPDGLWVPLAEVVQEVDAEQFWKKYERGEYLANARLIAAAPDLLDVAKELYTPFCNLVDLANRYDPEGVSAEEYRRFMAMVQRMHAAIAKAEGRDE